MRFRTYEIFVEELDIDEEQLLTESEVRKLRRFMKKQKDIAIEQGRTVHVKDWFLITLGLEAGLRVKEISDLSCGDLLVYEGRASVIVREGKGKKKRNVYIRKKFAELSREYLTWKQSIGDSIEKDAPVFSVAGRRMQKRALQKAYRRSVRKAGIEQRKGIGIHSLRHTFATILLKVSGNNIQYVKRQLGHKSITTTERYTHVSMRNTFMEKMYAGMEA